MISILTPSRRTTLQNVRDLQYHVYILSKSQNIDHTTRILFRKPVKAFGNLSTEKARNLKELRNSWDVLDAYKVKKRKKGAF